ncbi:hypothetical protein Emag_002823 [Eimeria magna]
MAALIAQVVRLNFATAENGWKDDAREGVTYANIHKGEVLDSGWQRNVAPPMEPCLGRFLTAGRRGRGTVVARMVKADLNVSLVVGAAGGRLGRRDRRRGLPHTGGARGAAEGASAGHRGAHHDWEGAAGAV